MPAGLEELAGPAHAAGDRTDTVFLRKTYHCPTVVREEEEEKQEEDAEVRSSGCGEGSAVCDEEEEKEKEVIASSVFGHDSAVHGYVDRRVMKTPALGDVVAGSAWEVYAGLDAKQVRCGIELLLGGGRREGGGVKTGEEEEEEQRGGEILAAGAELESNAFDPARVTTQTRKVAASEGVLLKVYTHRHVCVCVACNCHEQTQTGCEVLRVVDGERREDEWEVF